MNIIKDSSTEDLLPIAMVFGDYPEIIRQVQSCLKGRVVAP